MEGSHTGWLIGTTVLRNRMMYGLGRRPLLHACTCRNWPLPQPLIPLMYHCWYVHFTANTQKNLRPPCTKCTNTVASTHLLHLPDCVPTLCPPGHGRTTSMGWPCSWPPLGWASSPCCVCATHSPSNRPATLPMLLHHGPWRTPTPSAAMDLSHPARATGHQSRRYTPRAGTWWLWVTRTTHPR